jgi:hypothetical protein
MSVVNRLSTAYLAVRNPIFSIFENAATSGSADAVDIGYYGSYWNGSAVKYTGLFRDDSDDSHSYVLFDGLEVAPSENGSVNTDGVGFGYANLKLGVVDSRNTTESVSSSTGAIISAGGLGIAKNAHVEGDLVTNGSLNATNFNKTHAINGKLYMGNTYLLTNYSMDTGASNISNVSSGFVSHRGNVTNSDVPKISGVALTRNYVDGDTYLYVTASGSDAMNDYYKGWQFTVVDGSNAVQFDGYILSDVYAGGEHKLEIQTANVSNNGASVGVHTVNMFNKSIAGWIWNEPIQRMCLYGFPRTTDYYYMQLSESATDGSAPEYMDLAINKLLLNHALEAPANPFYVLNITDDGFTTITAEQVLTNSVIYISTTVEMSVSLPDMSGELSSSKGCRITIVNLIAPTNSLTITPSTGNIEGKSSYEMKNLYDKITFVSRPSGGWIIQ